MLLLLLPMALVTAQDCGEFTFSQCTRNVLESQAMPGGNVSHCQKHCQAKSSCDHFTYHKLTEVCTLASDEVVECNVVGGPDFPLVSSCLPAPPGCAQFRDEECDYDGPINSVYGHRAGPEECQEFMNQLGPEWGGGVAFTFKLKVQDMVIGTCQMLGSRGKDCWKVAGPKTPDYETC